MDKDISRLTWTETEDENGEPLEQPLMVIAEKAEDGTWQIFTQESFEVQWYCGRLTAGRQKKINSLLADPKSKIAPAISGGL